MHVHKMGELDLDFHQCIDKKYWCIDKIHLLLTMNSAFTIIKLS